MAGDSHGAIPAFSLNAGGLPSLTKQGDRAQAVRSAEALGTRLGSKWRADPTSTKHDAPRPHLAAKSITPA
jgi:hypothetical protein